MKRIALALCLLAATASGYDFSFTDAGVGFGSSDSESTSPLRYTISGDAMYIQTEYAGNVSMSVRANGYPSIACSLKLLRIYDCLRTEL